MRIVGGKRKGARLAAPSSDRVRPTSDRTREAIFNILAHGIDDFSLEDARVLDLFAGTGALGLEALSRGARYCLFVEDHVESRGLIRRNVETLEATGITKVYRRDATKLGDAGRMGKFDLVFADPPYGRGLAERALGEAHTQGWLSENAMIVVEEAAAAEITLPDGFSVIDQRVYGDTQALFARAVS